MTCRKIQWEKDNADALRAGREYYQSLNVAEELKTIKEIFNRKLTPPFLDFFYQELTRKTRDGPQSEVKGAADGLPRSGAIDYLIVNRVEILAQGRPGRIQKLKKIYAIE